MKKIFYFIIGISIILFCNNINLVKGKSLQSNNINLKNSNGVQTKIASKLIRFHVIANSDSKSDQALKLKVRDSVLEFIQPKLKNCKNIDESRKILRENDKEIIKIAEKIIDNNGYKYSVKTTLSQENFPIKSYGNITLPQGKYEAYRIIIGNGEGHNWWCVMFPPLCFVDITKGEVSYKQTEDQMKKVLTPDEYKMVNTQMTKGQTSNNIKIKFKFVELIKGFTSKL